jgi:hypothetical protein
MTFNFPRSFAQNDHFLVFFGVDLVQEEPDFSSFFKKNIQKSAYCLMTITNCMLKFDEKKRLFCCFRDLQKHEIPRRKSEKNEKKRHFLHQNDQKASLRENPIKNDPFFMFWGPKNEKK